MEHQFGLDAHSKPPDHVRAVYKLFQKWKPGLQKSSQDAHLLDFRAPLPHDVEKRVKTVHRYEASELRSIFAQFIGSSEADFDGGAEPISSSFPVYEHEDCPGLRIIPSIIPLQVQKALLNRLLHRDLVEPSHMTNVHLHHHMEYPPAKQSFFAWSQEPMPVLTPKDSSVHKPLTLQALLDRKLRWVTLGGQYDWTRKEYPLSKPPPFPPDIAQLLHDLCPDITPEAAICNLYTPGDTLSLHRDVSELCAAPLLSLSIGCDAIFVLSALKQPEEAGPATNDVHPPIAIRLRSGDLVYMSGESRFAWHGVPKVIPETCPDELADWPGNTLDGAFAESLGDYESWRGWMRHKRINLNVRQMYPGEWEGPA